MKIFAIADLHFSSSGDKPMWIFGAQWENHEARLTEFWNDTISEKDLVLIPGDICWAMRLEDAKADLSRIALLNGTKVLLRGNHDYWWNSVTRVREALSDSVLCIQNDSVTIGDVCVCGSRGWILPQLPSFSPENDKKIYEREILRLEMSLKSIDRDRELIAMTHFPPIAERGVDTGFTKLFETYKISRVVYGHLHAASCNFAFNGVHNGVTYHLCSADYLRLKPKLIFET
ncbi:MAG: metallophosphoesterase [Clostridia bacterium]